MSAKYQKKTYLEFKNTKEGQVIYRSIITARNSIIIIIITAPEVENGKLEL